MGQPARRGRGQGATLAGSTCLLCLPASRSGWSRTALAGEEAAALHADSELYDLDGVPRGRDDLRPWENDELRSLAALILVHLQCHIGP